MSKRLRLALVATALALAALAAGPPLVSAITATLFVTSTLEEPVNVDNDGIRFKTQGPTDVHVQEARWAPGDVVDWHNHPGFALIAVKSGTMTFYGPKCDKHVVGAGKAFVESGGPTKAANEGTTEAVIYVTYVVPHGSPRTVPTDPPRCPKQDDDEKGDKDDDNRKEQNNRKDDKRKNDDRRDDRRKNDDRRDDDRKNDDNRRKKNDEEDSDDS